MNDKRRHLTETALALFYRHGIHAVGINEVLKEAGVAKKTLYHHFDGKEALILAALELRHQRFMQWLTATIAPASSDADLIERLFQGLAQWFQGEVAELGEFRGCFFVNSAAEYAEGSIADCCQRHKQAVRECINSQLQGTNSPLLDGICLLKEGAISAAYVNRDPQQALRCIGLLQPLLPQQ